MIKQDEKAIDEKMVNETEEVSDFEQIIKTSIKAFYWTIVMLAFFSAIFISIFPYRATKFYARFDAKERMLETAESYIAMNIKRYSDTNQPSYDSKYADAVLTSVNTSISLMNQTANKRSYFDPLTLYYAEKVIKNVDLYLSYASLVTLSTSINESSRQRTTPALHVSISDFEGYIQNERIKALILTGQSGKVFAELLTSTNALTASNHMPSTDSIGYITQAFSRIAYAVKCEFEVLGYYEVERSSDGFPLINKLADAQLNVKTNSFEILYNPVPYSPLGGNGITYSAGATPLYERIKNNIEVYKDYIMQLSGGSDRGTTLNILFYSKALADIITVFYEFSFFIKQPYFSVFDDSELNIEDSRRIVNDENVEFWNAKLKFSNDIFSPSQWFNNVVLPKYTRLFA